MLSIYNIVALVCVVAAAVLVQFIFRPDPSGSTTTVLNSSYDFIVIGSGPAGSVVASRLSEKRNLQVLLVEIGKEDRGQPYHVPALMYDLRNTEANWKYSMEKQKFAHLTRHPGLEETWNAGRVLGGGASINAMQYTRGSRHDYNKWEELGCNGWSYDDVLPYFLKSEDVKVEALQSSKFHSTTGYLGVGVTGPDKLYQYVVQAAKEMNLSEIDHNGENMCGISRHFTTTKGGERSSPCADLLKPAMKRDNLHVSVQTQATKVIFEGKHAKRVRIIKNGEEHLVDAKKEIIVSAGAIESPKLLMLSGVGPASHLIEMDIPVIADLPVGQNLNYHYTVPIWLDTNRTDMSLSEPTVMDHLEYAALRTGRLTVTRGVAVMFIRNDNGEGAPDNQLDLYPYKLPPMDHALPDHKQIAKEPGLTFQIFPSRSKSRGFIQLRSSDANDQPVIDPQYMADESDVQTPKGGIQFIKSLIQTQAMKAINASFEVNRIKPCDQELFDSDRYWDCFIRHTTLGTHFSGTCKMGALTDPTVVVDSRLRVKGVTGLRVIDASVMPFTTSGNTNVPTIMIGEKGVDMILEDMKNNGEL